MSGCNWSVHGRSVCAARNIEEEGIVLVEEANGADRSSYGCAKACCRSTVKNTRV
jgi:hypothetical protein